jgi:hypothetical protein
MGASIGLVAGLLACGLSVRTQKFQYEEQFLQL